MFNLFKRKIKLRKECIDCDKYNKENPYYKYLIENPYEGIEDNCVPCKIDLIKAQCK